MKQELWVFLLACTVFLLVAVWWKNRPVPRAEGCEALCLARDAECSAYAASQGGFPALDLPTSERESLCNGLCYVLRRAKPPNALEECFE